MHFLALVTPSRFFEALRFLEEAGARRAFSSYLVD